MKGKVYALLVVALLSSSSVAAQEKTKLEAKTKKGAIQFVSEDEKFKYSVGGRVYLDAAAYFDDKTDLGSGSELRDVRLLFKATVWEKWDAKINLGFAGGQVAAKDIFIAYNFNGNSHLRTGYFFEPFGLERTESSKNIKFLELAGTTEAFAPGRNLGFEYATWSDKTYWGAGLFGDADLNNSTGGDEGFGITSRFVFAPINENGKIFHIGGAATYREADAAGFGDDGKELDKSIRYRARAATHVESRRFIDAKVGMADSQFKYGVEILAATGPLALQGEYIGAEVSRESGVEDFSAKGWYAQLGWLLNGKDYKYQMKSARLSKPGPGTVELLLRYNQTDLNDSDAGIMGGEQKDISLGFIYYINHNMLVKFNYANVDLDEHASYGEENFNLVQARFQVAF